MKDNTIRTMGFFGGDWRRCELCRHWQRIGDNNCGLCNRLNVETYELDWCTYFDKKGGE